MVDFIYDLESLEGLSVATTFARMLSFFDPKTENWHFYAEESLANAF
jgi:hypothetical protein